MAPGTEIPVKTMPTTSALPKSNLEHVRQHKPAHLWKPGVSGNPSGRRSKPKPTISDTEFLAQPIDKKVSILKNQAAEIAFRLGDDLRSELVDTKTKKNYQKIRDIAGPWGIAADKLLKNDSESAISVKVPSALVGTMQIGIVIRPVDNTPSCESLSITQ